MVLGVAVSLIFLQLSCAGVKGPSAGEASKATEAASEVEPFLAGTHQAAGNSCSDCHEESPAAVAVPGSVCMTCHEDYKDATADMYEDPHDAHLEYDCGECHHAHKASENLCMQCHAFDVTTP